MPSYHIFLLFALIFGEKKSSLIIGFDQIL